MLESTGAADRNRTGDLLITNQLLYQLSYSSEERGIYNSLRQCSSLGRRKNVLRGLLARFYISLLLADDCW